MKIYPGMILRVWSARKNVYHYGIASYNGNVIDHAPRKGTAMRTWEEFSEGEEVEIVNRKEGDYSPKVIHERAYSEIGRNSYSVFGLNCEHFVSKCVRGKAESMQLREIGEKVALGAVIGLGVGLLISALFDENENEDEVA